MTAAMAPLNADLQPVQENTKNVIQDLFQILAQVSNYDTAGRPSREALAQDIQSLSTSLHQIHHTASALPADLTPGIPEPLVQYVENGRNPDIYTREFVELVRRLNQLTRGKTHAFRDFRDVLAREMRGALPELADDVRMVVAATGGETEAGGGAGSGTGTGTGTGAGEGRNGDGDGSGNGNGNGTA
ncbi:hypothetical protein BT67DRAFT_461783 [Trichocladium antarcticum]|uniref:Mediator of RNA polymerase II transcription subunit 10 n=1 Tax=Trichocladium antarcticum TaxID=1450529 RepID=A0AAN6ZEL1_9PEZI|nr:hypothetical protein BT67DRAFT_461783 [Trichocladium antarcticum]